MAAGKTVQLYLIGFYKDLITSLLIQYKVPKRSNCLVLVSLNVELSSFSVLLRKKPYGCLIFERNGR